MGTIKRFEDLELWQMARELAKKVKVLTQTELFSRDFRFRDQTNASAGSVMDNIAEGFERSGRLEFVNFLSIAKGSTGEVRSQLYRAIDYNYLTGARCSSFNKRVRIFSIQNFWFHWLSE